MTIRRIKTKKGNTVLQDTKTGRLLGSAININRIPRSQRERDGLPKKPRKRWGVPLSVSHPILAKYAYQWDPSNVTAGSSRSLEWACSECDNTWKALVKVRAKTIPYVRNVPLFHWQ